MGHAECALGESTVFAQAEIREIGAPDFQEIVLYTLLVKHWPMLTVHKQFLCSVLLLFFLISCFQCSSNYPTISIGHTCLSQTTVTTFNT